MTIIRITCTNLSTCTLNLNLNILHQLDIQKWLLKTIKAILILILKFTAIIAICLLHLSGILLLQIYKTIVTAHYKQKGIILYKFINYVSQYIYNTWFWLQVEMVMFWTLVVVIAICVLVFNVLRVMYNSVVGILIIVYEWLYDSKDIIVKLRDEVEEWIRMDCMAMIMGFNICYDLMNSLMLEFVEYWEENIDWSYMEVFEDLW